MMDIVGSLGRSLAETLLDLVTHQDSRKELLDMVGLNQEEGKPKEEKQSEKKKYETIPSTSEDVEEKSVPEPWSFFKDDVNEKIQQRIGEVMSLPTCQNCLSNYDCDDCEDRLQKAIAGAVAETGDEEMADCRFPRSRQPCDD